MSNNTAPGEQYGPGDLTPADSLLSIHNDGAAEVHRVGENTFLSSPDSDTDE